MFCGIAVGQRLPAGFDVEAAKIEQELLRQARAAHGNLLESRRDRRSTQPIR
jgi:hypothetical protein